MAAFSLRGYWRTLSVRIACTPAMMMIRLTTMAMTGRRMKRSVKLELGWTEDSVLMGMFLLLSDRPARGRTAQAQRARC